MWHDGDGRLFQEGQARAAMLPSEKSAAVTTTEAQVMEKLKEMEAKTGGGKSTVCIFTNTLNNTFHNAMLVSVYGKCKRVGIRFCI